MKVHFSADEVKAILLEYVRGLIPSQQFNAVEASYIPEITVTFKQEQNNAAQ